MTSSIRKSCSPTQDSAELSEGNKDGHQKEERSSSPNEDDVIMTDEKGSASTDEVEDPILIPPSVPKNGISILAHKLWIGNLDKRLTGYVIIKSMVCNISSLSN